MWVMISITIFVALIAIVQGFTKIMDGKEEKRKPLLSIKLKDKNGNDIDIKGFTREGNKLTLIK